MKAIKTDIPHTATLVRSATRFFFEEFIFSHENCMDIVSAEEWSQE